ncbi:thioesterase II family protein [Nocardia suismassiliense]|uniref:Thioesterase TesA n=1 Tax=Nocardia suismassiliense TaxID=2077092 RepID=A0ABW6R167_9NOCA
MSALRNEPVGTWLRRIALPRPDAGIELICFPHAGGSAPYFAQLARCIDPMIEPLAVQYPGRQDRRDEEMPASIEQLAVGVGAELPAAVGNREFALYGHSMGAVVAFEVCRRLAGTGLVPRVLFVSGRRSPLSTRTENIHRYSEDDLARELRRAADNPPTWLRDPELRSLLLPVVRADFRAVESYVYQEGPPIECPIVAMIGNNDPYVDTEEAKAWSACTSREFELHTFPGKHFFLESNASVVGGLLTAKTISQLDEIDSFVDRES